MSISARVRQHIRSNLVGYLALFLFALAVPAWAIERNSVRSHHIVNGQVKKQDIRLPLALSGTFDSTAGPPPKPKATLSVGNKGAGRAIRVTAAGEYGIELANITGPDGIRVNDTGDDGIQMGSDPNYPNYGFYIPSPGVSTYGLWPNTAAPSGNWALFTVDNIEAGNVAASAFTALAKVTGEAELRRGDVAAAGGVAAPIPGGTSDLVRVQRANGSATPVGVVRERMVFRPAPGKTEPALRSAAGPAQAGDYVAVTVLGIAEVRLAEGAEVAQGDRLAAGRAGARELRTAQVEGVEVAEDRPTIGPALAEPDPARGTVQVFVSPG